MKSAVIYYFSGTGNTEIVARMIKEAFLQNDYSIDLVRIEDILKNNQKVDPSKYDLIGIGSQIIGYSTPEIVLNFIHTLPSLTGKKVFIFRTAGGVAPINYNASKPAIRALNRKGYDVFHERIFSLSSNWIQRFDNIIVQQLYSATQKKAQIMCQDIIQGKQRILKTGLLLRTIIGILSMSDPIFFRLVGKDYTVSSECTLCGHCIKNCPVNNIYKRNDQIKFKLSCNGCMRCVYACPKKAIHFKFLKFFYVPGGYNIKKILSEPGIPSESANPTSPQFFNRYISDDAF